jgi:SNF2 family DNA or RNA helicase
MRTLYPHQERALDKLPRSGGYLAFEQGLGKTLTSIEYAVQHGYRRIVVVCPAVVLGVWRNELEAQGEGAFMPTGSRQRKAREIYGYPDSSGARRDFLVLNYEALLDPDVEKAVKLWRPDLLIVDEAHKAKTATAKRSKVLHRLGKEVPALLLSGTPITKNLLDLYSQYKIIDPTIWGGLSWTRFRQWYGVWGGYGGYELIGYRNTGELKDKIKPFTVVARKDDVLDLPPKIFQTVPVTLSGPAWTEYSRMAKDGVTDEWLTTNPLEKMLRLAQISSRSRTEETARFVSDLRESDEQVVVYARFRADLEVLSDLLNVEALTGSTPVEERAIMVERFQSGEEKIFLAQVQAGSTGITLTAASHMVYHSLTFSYEDWAQSQDRIHRIGTERVCNYYVMESVGPKGGRTVDGLMRFANDNKQDVSEMVTKDPSLLLPKE